MGLAAQIAFFAGCRHNGGHVKLENTAAGAKWHALGFGLFLGLCIWKFGDPVILDRKIATPATAADFLGDAWPTHWAYWALAPLMALGAWLVFRERRSADGGRGWVRRGLWLLPLAWLGWQFVSASRTVNGELTTATLWQFGGCVAGYFLGAKLFARERRAQWLLVGALAAFAFCLVRAVDQRLFEYPQSLHWMREGERSGWTNFPPETVTEMKNAGMIVTTNGVDVANPMIVAKFSKGRVSGTLVYPNALAEIILLLWPVSLVLAFGGTKALRPPVRLAAIGMTCFLGGAAFFWTGSKLGWLIGMGVAGLALLRLNWPRRLKLAAVAMVLVLGLGVFAVRFHQYFAAGATSAGARLDYWRAAVQTTASNPWLGTGPGTFGESYAKIKLPASEMARLAHNDYLEQFSDSGIPGGLAYGAWILLALAVAARKVWRAGDAFWLAVFLGLTGWFAQGLGEFGLYVPGLAWPAFTLLGCLIGQKGGRNWAA
jgi:hypothetical protein